WFLLTLLPSFTSDRGFADAVEIKKTADDILKRLTPITKTDDWDYNHNSAFFMGVEFSNLWCEARPKINEQLIQEWEEVGGKAAIEALREAELKKYVVPDRHGRLKKCNSGNAGERCYCDLRMHPKYCDVLAKIDDWSTHGAYIGITFSPTCNATTPCPTHPNHFGGTAKIARPVPIVAEPARCLDNIEAEMSASSPRFIAYMKAKALNRQTIDVKLPLAEDLEPKIFASGSTRAPTMRCSRTITILR
ncbi:hypothetical protein PFISCL1PPCAC_12035, partial [Pristionchus fissidentatus]